MKNFIFTARKRSLGKVIFSEACVQEFCHGGGGLPQCTKIAKYNKHPRTRQATPVDQAFFNPRDQAPHPLGPGTPAPQDQAHPLGPGRHPQDQAGTPGNQA